MGNLLKIVKMMDTAEIAVQLRALELTKFVVLRMIEYLVAQTPVDTSKALSNWRVAVGGSGYGAEAIPAYYVGSAGSTQDASSRAAIDAAKAALKTARAGSPIAIINQVPYIGELAAGSSAQAPAGWVEGAILVGRYAAKEYNFSRRLAQDIKRGKVVPDG